MRKKQRISPCGKCYNRFMDLDMFGEQIKFNISGRTHFNTCCGVIFTLAILLITAGAFYFALMRGMTEHDVPIVIS